MGTKIDFNIAKEVLRLRVSQLVINEKYKQGLFKIPIHLAMGHEAIAVSVDTVMTEQDFLVLSHRNIHYNLARSKLLRPILDEFLLDKCGLAHGQLGSMNLADRENNIVYTSSILGNNLSAAAGFALAQKVKKSHGVVFVVTGDGAIEEGTFYESLLFMKSVGLAVIIIVENNGWSMHTSISERRCPIDLSAFAASVGASYHLFKGNDVYKYIDCLTTLRECVSKSASPSIVEVKLTTLGGLHVEDHVSKAGRFVHPHAGPVRTLDSHDLRAIENTPEDPIFILQNYFSDQILLSAGEEIFVSIKDQIGEV